MGYTLIGAVKSRAFRVLWTLEELGSTMTISTPPQDPQR